MSSSLPPNWLELRTPDGRFYYVDTATGHSQWHHPTHNAFSPPSQTLGSSSLTVTNLHASGARKEPYEVGRFVSDHARQFKLLSRPHPPRFKVVESDTRRELFTMELPNRRRKLTVYTNERALLFEASRYGGRSGVDVVNVETREQIFSFERVGGILSRKAYGYRWHSGGDPCINVERINNIFSTELKMTEIATGRDLGSMREVTVFYHDARVEAGLDAALVLCMMLAGARSWGQMI